MVKRFESYQKWKDPRDDPSHPASFQSVEKAFGKGKLSRQDLLKKAEESFQSQSDVCSKFIEASEAAEVQRIGAEAKASAQEGLDAGNDLLDEFYYFRK
jgi:hypothetical protein